MQKYKIYSSDIPGLPLDSPAVTDMYLASEADAEIAKLKELLRRVIEWTPALPVESSLADEIAEAIKL